MAQLPKIKLSDKARKRAAAIRKLEAGADAPETRIPAGETSLKKGGMTKPPAGARMATPAETKSLAQKGVAAVREKKAAAAPARGTLAASEGETPGRRITVEKAVAKRARRWGSVQQKGLISATRAAPAPEGGFKRIGAQKQIQAAAEAQQAGRPVTRPVPLKQITARATEVGAAAPAPTTAAPAARTRRIMGVGRRVKGGRVPSPMTDVAAAAQKIASTTAGEGAGRIARAAAASYRGVGGALAKAPLAPVGAQIGHAMGAPSGRGKAGAAIGATAASATAIVPKFLGGAAVRAAAGKVALPLAVAETTTKVGELGYRMGQAVGAQRHLKKQAKGLAKMGVTTKKHGFWKGYGRSWEGATTEAATGLRIKVDPKKSAAATKKMRAGVEAKASPRMKRTLGGLRKAKKK